MEYADRNYARELARRAGNEEALDFIDVAEDAQLEDLVRHFEVKLERQGAAN